MERLPGFRDFYPEPLPPSEGWSAGVRRHIFEVWRGAAWRYGFREYDGPPLEPLELYTVKSGEEIVRQLYNFTDKGERAVALRPEMTPTLARMVAARERSYRKPIKWFAIPQLFRYEKQQKGRLREHFQFNADIFGETSRGADAELIALMIDALRGLGLGAEDFVVRLSSRDAWQEFYLNRGGTVGREDDFYQIIDKLEREDAAAGEARLRELGIDPEAVRAFIAEARPTAELQGMVEDLAARGLGEFVRVDYRVVRGLAYYTGPVFEAFDRGGEFRAIAGGGRYDHLVRTVTGGKVDLPGLGFGMGDVVLTELLKARGKVPVLAEGLDVFVLIEEESSRWDSLRLVQRLREAGRSVEYPMAPAKSDKQFKRAIEQGAAHCCRLARASTGEFQAVLKNLKTREEKTLSLEALVAQFGR